MKQLQEYREHAAECRGMGAKIIDNRLRTQMLDIARQWDTLADERERLLTMPEKLFSENIIAPTPVAIPDLAPALPAPASNGSSRRYAASRGLP